jgi:hypothetical protein
MPDERVKAIESNSLPGLKVWNGLPGEMSTMQR